MGIKVLGYYVDRNGNENSAYDVFVAIDEGVKEKLTYYCPIGQHQQGDRGYMDECNPITKEQYLKASSDLYTPVAYLGGDSNG
jgi:hypothetical protein